MDFGEYQSNIAQLRALLERIYNLVDYARKKQETAPIALADAHHPGHVDNDLEFVGRREELLEDIRYLLETRWDSLEFPKLRAKLERRKPTIPPGMSPGIKGLYRCRCWWDAKDELQEMADYLQALKDTQETSAMGLRTQKVGNEKSSSSIAPWLSGTFYVVAFIMSTGLAYVVYTQIGFVGAAFVIIAALLIFSSIGAFQLRQDRSLSQKNFLQLMGLVFKQIPYLFKAHNSNLDK